MTFNMNTAKEIVIYVKKYYSVFRNKLLIHESTCLNLKNIILNERS